MDSQEYQEYKVPQVSCYHPITPETKVPVLSETLCTLCEAWVLFFTKQYADSIEVQ